MSRLAIGMALATFALLSALWALWLAPPALSVQLAGPTMRQVTQGETVSTASLAQAVAHLGNVDTHLCYERHLWNALVLHLYRLERVPIAASGERDRMLTEANHLALALVTCSPRQALGWFVIAWVGIAQDGMQPEHTEKLAFSYRLAPREDWIASVRNPFAIRLYPFVDEALRAPIRQEFTNLVRARMSSEAVRSLQSASPEIVSDLLESIRGVPEEQRRQLARKIEASGLVIEVPGISRDMQRPWR